LKAAEYQSGMSQVFSSVGDVEGLCSHLIGFKSKINRNRLADLIMVPGGGLGLVVMRPQQNLHFFRTGVNPVWEDPWNSKGGRLTLTPPLVLLDPMFESVVLLMAGEMEKKKPKVGGRVVGVVGSRRSKGDRIEIWLSGPSIGTAPEEEWIKSVQEVLGREIGTPDSKSLKYKKHLP
ncbi:translation initiation factor eIF 4e-like domain-containing protein, partial [Phakopsora pachyrhizi]